MTNAAFRVCLLLSAAAAIAAPGAVNASAQPAPATKEELGFFGGTREEVLSQCKRVGLIPLPRPTLVGVEPDASTRIEAALANALKQAGLDVVGTDSYTKAYDRFNKAVGGVYDPFLGSPRKDASTGVAQNAIREFITQERLGCVVVARAIDTKAQVTGNLARWDGAVEFVDGQANSGLSRTFFGNEGTGSLRAVSLALQLQSREGKVMYSRSGGVQLESYLDRQHGNDESSFLIVPRAKLLLDDKRIERALTFATVPLRYTADEIAAGAKGPAPNTYDIAPAQMPAPPAGLQVSEDSPLKAPRDQILGKVHRVVLGPVMPSGITPPPDAVPRYRALVHDRLARLGWEVIDTDNLMLAVGSSMQKSGGLYDPLSGKLDPDKLKSVFQLATKTLGITPPPDAIATITVSKTAAPQKWATATWDGTQQNAMTLGPAINRAKLFGGTENPSAGEGVMSASSVYVMLRDTDGTVLYEGRGGIELLQQLSIKNQMSGRTINYVQTLTALAPSELFKDPARDERAVDVALHELLVSPEDIAAAAAKAKTQKH